MDDEQPQEPELQEPDRQDSEAIQDEPEAGSAVSPDEPDEQDDDQEDGSAEDTKKYKPLRPSSLASTGWTDAELRSLARQYGELVNNRDLRRNAELGRRLAESLHASGVAKRVALSPAMQQSIASVQRLVTSLYLKPNSELSRTLKMVSEVSVRVVHRALDEPTRAAIASAAASMQTDPALQEALGSIADEMTHLVENAGTREALKRLWNPKFDAPTIRVTIQRLDGKARRDLEDLAHHITAEDVSTLTEQSLAGADPELIATAYERLSARRHEFTSYEDVEQATREVLHDLDPSLDPESSTDESVVAQESLMQVFVSMGAGDGGDAETKRFSKEVGGTLAVGTVGFFVVMWVVNPAFLASLFILLQVLGYGALVYKKTTKAMEAED